MRIGFNADPDPTFKVYADPEADSDPDPRFWLTKMEKNTAVKSK